jgi:hypothetical protein
MAAENCSLGSITADTRGGYHPTLDDRCLLTIEVATWLLDM